MQSIARTILSQYANSPRLRLIIESFNQACDPRDLIETFLEHVWNPDTATGWGLDVWGRIVGVGRVLKVPADAWFGFAQADDGSETITPFNDRQFYRGSGESGGAYIANNYILDDEAYRKLIYAKAAANITNGSIANINAILMRLFGGAGKRIWVVDGGNPGPNPKPIPDPIFGYTEADQELNPPEGFNTGLFWSDDMAGNTGGGDDEPTPERKPMTMTVCYDFTLSPVDAVIIENSGILPRPSGVYASYKRVNPSGEDASMFMMLGASEGNSF